MENKYYEIVFEGHYKAVYGLLQGFMLGKNQSWKFFFSKKAGIKTETLTEIIADWISMSSKVHHVIMEADFYEEFKKAISEFNSSRDVESKFVHTKYIKSVQEVKGASFNFTARAYAEKYGTEIKAILNSLPQGLELHNYNPLERKDEDAKGVEMYAPEHEYTFEATGTLSGNLGELIELRKTLDDHPLVEVEKIELKF